MIPNVLHLVWLDGGAFSALNYLCVSSALHKNGFDEAVLHCDQEPKGYWWERLKDKIALDYVKRPREVAGRPIVHPAHATDLLRLQILHSEGGIYLDNDVLCVRPFADLRDLRTVLGQEGSDVPAQTPGACNAVILAEPGSTFLAEWLRGFDPLTSHWEGFRSLGRDRYWSEYSVQYPAYLAAMRSDVTLLNADAFFFPMWYELDLQNFFEKSGPVPPGAYCHHLWQSHPFVRECFKENTLERAGRGESIFDNQVRMAFDDEVEQYL
ncbi:glycosyltransferase [Curtobacterium sp. BRD11]|uniref:glycosyltransferase family 32 protein n=1 Tax=Curtobacterium sp. BRD11 TaxID=2962581 RepID=UPI00288164B1|nr:glycosyltransferase [Curtobacterium sp. BRD11]MDT0212066.1 glycosyltransferase [Curtobacterium sp. BRD11]